MDNTGGTSAKPDGQPSNYEEARVGAQQLHRAIGKLHFLIDKIENGEGPKKAENPLPPTQLSLADFLQHLPTELLELKEQVQDAYQRLDKLLFGPRTV